MTLSGYGDRIREKPSIYPRPEPELVLIETHSALEQQIAATRHVVTSTCIGARARLQGIVNRWIGVEHAVERRVKSLIPVDESLTPGALYVGVATLTGSVLARNRSFLLRSSLPPALFLLSMNHFLPKTSQNLSDYFSSLERAHAPSIAEAHEQLNEGVRSTSTATRQAWANTRVKFVGGVERTVSKLQERTGLKLRETLGWSKGVVGEIETEVKEVANRVEDKVKDLRK